MSTERISSYEEFWPFYLSEHRDTRSRRLHFLGTTGFTAAVVGSFISNPIGFGMAMAGWGLIMRDGLKKGEAERPSFRHVLGMLVRAHDDADGRLNDDELIATLILFLFAGHETTTNLIGNARAKIMI